MKAPENSRSPKILVGICSARDKKPRRDAVRETWLSCPVDGIECVFFVGGGEPLPEEGDVLALDVPDGYDYLPAKVVAFFRHALEVYNFDWLFKCDDDTYLTLDRLEDLLASGADLVGNEFVAERGSPSGGAGYLLSRAIVEKLVEDRDLPATGLEDIIIGEAAIRHGARAEATSRLCWTNERFPQRDNDIITSHWCSPGRLRAVHASLHELPVIVDARHACWFDNLQLFPSGIFSRTKARCCGTWQRSEDGGILLRWFDWPEEKLVPNRPTPSGNWAETYRCVPFLDATNARPPAIPLSPMDHEPRHICVWSTTASYGLPHLDSFLRSNPGVPVHVVSNAECGGAAQAIAWRNPDRLIRNWWLLQGSKLRFDYAAFIEWDVLFNKSLDEVFPGETDFYSNDVQTPDDRPWGWFDEIPFLPESLQPFATGVTPLAVTRISRRCLEAMFSHPDSDELYERDIFCELRLATLASACGYKPVPCPGTLTNVDFRPVASGSGTGVWHAVKSRRSKSASDVEECGIPQV
jgi:hypothetical protein